MQRCGIEVRSIRPYEGAGLRLTRLQELPVMLQFHPMDFRQCVHETLLRPWQATAKALNGVDRKDSRLLLLSTHENGPGGAARRLRRTSE